MRFTRFALGAGVVVVVAFMLLVAIGIHGALTPVIAIVALVVLIACGNLLYGKNSHGAAAQARVRPAQEAQNRAIDEAQARARLEREQARRPAEGGPQVSLFRDTGVVLRTYRLGEADRIIVLMTEQHGKVRAVAKGVRRTSSKFGARLEPLTHVDLLLWQGRGDLDIVNQVEVIETFRAVREDLSPRGQGHGAPGGDRPDGPGAPPRPAALRHVGGGAAGPVRRWRRPHAAGALLLPQGARARGGGARCSMRAPRAASPTARSSWSPSTWSRGARCAVAAAGAAR